MTAADLQIAKQYLAGRHFDQAQQACRAVLQSEPRNLDALLSLSMAYFGQGDFVHSLQALHEAHAHYPNHHGVIFNLGHVLGAMGHYEEAQEHFDRVLHLAPQFAPAVAAKADLAEKHGDYDLVRHTLQPIMLSGMANADMALVWARMLHHHDADHEQAADIARRYSQDANATPPARRQLLFLAGQALEKAQRFDDAFEAYSQANSVVRPMYDPAAYQSRVRTLIEFFTRDRVESLPRATGNSRAPVFLVGMPRTGSTLIEQVIHAHPGGHGAGEVTAMLDVVRTLEMGAASPYPHCVDACDESTANELQHRYLHLLQQGGSLDGVDRIADKLLINYEYLGLIQTILPEAHIIDCRRDPVDTCLSCYCSALATEVFPFASDLAHLGAHYRTYEQLMNHWSNVLDISILRAPYDDLVRDPETWFRKTIEFCGLDWHDDCMRFHEADRHVHTLSYDQVRRPVYQSSAGRAQRFANHLAPLRETLDRKE